MAHLDYKLMTYTLEIDIARAYFKHLFVCYPHAMSSVDFFWYVLTSKTLNLHVV